MAGATIPAMPMTLSAYIAQAPALPADKDRSEVRVYATIVTGCVFVSFVMTAVHAALLPSLLHRVAALTPFPNTVAFAFVLLAFGITPHLSDLMVRPGRLRLKWPRKIAAGSMFVAGILWGMLATAARPLEAGAWLPLTYWATAAAYLLVGGAYGYSLNAQLASEHDEKTSQVG